MCNYLPRPWSINNSNKNSYGWYLLSLCYGPDCSHGLHLSFIQHSPQLFIVAGIYSHFTDGEMANLKPKFMSICCSSGILNWRWFVPLPSRTHHSNIWRHFWLQLVGNMLPASSGWKPPMSVVPRRREPALEFAQLMGSSKSLDLEGVTRSSSFSLIPGKQFLMPSMHLCWITSFFLLEKVLAKKW